MKKLKLKALSFGAREILSREQLKSITGGCDNDHPCISGYWCDAGSCKLYGPGAPGSGSGGSGSGYDFPCTDGRVPCSCTSGCYLPIDCDALC